MLPEKAQPFPALRAEKPPVVLKPPGAFLSRSAQASFPGYGHEAVSYSEMRRQPLQQLPPQINPIFAGPF
jgi:hypothetical protein